MASVANLPVYMLPGASVVQQPRSGLDGDSSLATEILPGPPSVTSALQAVSKRDPRKPGPLISYLPQHDPGTTYAGMLTGPLVGSLEGKTEVDGPRRKRARVYKGLASQRSQRASTRAINSAPPADDVEMTDGICLPDPYPDGTGPDSDGPLPSRSNSVSNVEESASRESGAQKRDKGKGRAKDIIRVKEEQVPVTLQATDPLSAARNEDHCSACRSLGSLVYCDGCTRAYHLWCLDPPMDAKDVPEGDNRWFCPSCSLRQNSPPKPPYSLLSPAIQHMQGLPPVEFQLPEDIRTHFKSVGSNNRGAYTDTSIVKQPRLNRHGQLEERDPYRTKDRNGSPVLCYQCGTSALPDSMATTAPPPKRPRRASTLPVGADQWKRIVSCDHCPLHWHLDCIDPPLLAMPPFDKKWMCPNHVDHTLRTKRRIPRQQPPLIDVARAGQTNNGNIEVTEPEAFSTHSKVIVDEVYINGRRYRVPERVIKVDFWNKVKAAGGQSIDVVSGVSSGMSSPLTSLSSLEDDDETKSVAHGMTIPEALDVEDLRLAILLLDFAGNRSLPTSSASPTSAVTSSTVNDPKLMVDDSIQTDAIPSAPVARRSRQSAAKATDRPAKPGMALKIEELSDKELGPSPERRQPARASKRDVKYVRHI
ncbi:hypothetical protein FA95DRAFT_1582351 [Auriscalpium vulgare]|uniref:Uncharacterized protein n=1 Tax=Auriscalpium vulgare TaxID=40419 RepID=A0ACB8RVJ1_9AGAM|nr:hypothetical protein FA95DRAFT_1582351 [Auriscalpium vulgare]